ncbi:MAG: aspartyl protease family protein [Bacteroidota bacterium]|nr:aspartyl protease family protein [Bacteroidota bacterium]
MISVRKTMRKILYFLIVLCLSQTKVVAQNINLNQGGANKSGYLIKLPYEIIKNKIIVTAEVGGKKRRFILDTGAPVAIFRHLFNEINPSVYDTKILTDANGRKDSAQTVIIGDISLGDVSFKNIPALVVQEDLFTDCFHVDGILGSNLFRKSIVRISALDKTVTITDDRNKLPLRNVPSSPLTLDQQSNPYIWVTFRNNLNEMVLFDSGADEYYTISRDHFAKMKKFKAFQTIAEGYGSNSISIAGLAENEMLSKLFIPILSINGTEIDNIIAETTSSPVSRVGAKILRFGVITLDFRNGRFYYQPYLPINDAREKRWNMSMVVKDGLLWVSAIWGKTDGRVQIGDQILMIDGVDCKNLTLCDILDNPFLKDKNEAFLIIKKDNGETTDWEIKKE